MGTYRATVSWQRQDARFTDNRYSRAHQWEFDGGTKVGASSSEQVVPLPMSDPTKVDPEEAFVAALSSCHMLWFLSLAARRGYVVDSYHDRAEGVLAPDENGRAWMTRVFLRPEIVVGGDKAMSDDELHELHNEAHERCFIANSVRSEVLIAPAVVGLA